MSAMDECKICANADNEYCFACDNGNQFKPNTNAERIRGMSDEELAEFMRSVCDTWYIDANQNWLEWLKSPAKGAE